MQLNPKIYRPITLLSNVVHGPVFSELISESHRSLFSTKYYITSRCWTHKTPTNQMKLLTNSQNQHHKKSVIKTKSFFEKKGVIEKVRTN